MDIKELQRLFKGYKDFRGIKAYGLAVSYLVRIVKMMQREIDRLERFENAIEKREEPKEHNLK